MSKMLLIGVRVNDSMRWKAWRKYATVRNNRLEKFKTFDAKVYSIGLKHLKEHKRRVKG
jgi:hypothetical protein